jgi:hypothetical protein
MSFCLSFHQALPGPTGAHWLDHSPRGRSSDEWRELVAASSWAKRMSSPAPASMLAAQRELSMCGNKVAIATEGYPSSERGRFGDNPVKLLPHAW